MADTYTPNLNLKKPGYDSPADIADINANMDKIDTSINQLSQQMADYRTAVDLLVNSDFRNPVNQRGKTQYTGTGYIVDRWRNETSRSVTSVSDAGLGVSNSNPSAGITYVQQILPESVVSYTKDADKTYTFAAKIDGSVYVVCGKPKETKTTPTPFGEMAFMYSAGAALMVARFVITESDEHIIEWAALYEGSYTVETLPPYMPKENELALCQKRFLNFPNNAYLSLQGYAQNETTLRVTIPTPVTMASDVAGSITFEDISAIRILPAGKAVTAASLSSVVSTNAITASFTAAGLTPNDIYFVKMNSGFSISKEL